MFMFFMQMMEDGNAPSMLGTETAFHYGYALLAIMGGQRVVATHDSVQPDHVAVLNLVLECGAPPDLPDILGYTPLHHVCMARERLDLLRTLLEHGANPNAQDRFGCVPITSACQRNYVDTIDVLMEFGASLDVEDADGCTPEEFYPKGGAYVTAVVQKWKRRRAGETVALNEEGCTTCGKVVPKLKYCASCHAARYCSKDCQSTSFSRGLYAHADPATIFQEHIGPYIRRSASPSAQRRPSRWSHSMKISVNSGIRQTSCALFTASVFRNSPPVTAARCTGHNYVRERRRRWSSRFRSHSILALGNLQPQRPET